MPWLNKGLANTAATAESEMQPASIDENVHQYNNYTMPMEQRGTTYETPGTTAVNQYEALQRPATVDEDNTVSLEMPGATYETPGEYTTAVNQYDALQKAVTDYEEIRPSEL